MSRKYWSIIGFILLMLAFAFFWYQIRPSAIRASCGKKAIDTLKNNSTNLSIDHWKSTYNLLFESCLHQKGL